MDFRHSPETKWSTEEGKYGVGTEDSGRELWSAPLSLPCAWVVKRTEQGHSELP